MELEHLIPKLFMASAGISILSCLARPDFNLPLFVFAWLIWAQPEKVITIQTERVKVLMLIVVTFLVDFIWLCYWGSAWSEDNLAETWERGVQHFVLVLSIINFLVKLGVIVLVVMTEKSNISENIPSKLSSMLPISNQ